MGFAARLDQLLASRKPYPWGQALGISPGAVATMLRGRVPRGEVLVRIHHAENAALSWLLAGVGPPYVVNAPLTDNDAQELLSSLLAADERGWHLLVAAAAPRYALVLARESRMAVRGRPIDFCETRVIGGPMPGPLLLRAVAGELGRYPCSLVHVGSGDWARIAGGKVGTWELLRAPGALLAPERRIALDHGDRLEAELATGQVSESAGNYAPPQPLHLGETELLACYRQLDGRDRRRALGIAQLLAQDVE